MATDCIPQLTFTFQEKQRPVVARFDQSHASTDGGTVLLSALLVGFNLRRGGDLLAWRHPYYTTSVDRHDANRALLANDIAATTKSMTWRRSRRRSRCK